MCVGGGTGGFPWRPLKRSKLAISKYEE
jgi:hypothetical protein